LEKDRGATDSCVAHGGSSRAKVGAVDSGKQAQILPLPDVDTDMPLPFAPEEYADRIQRFKLEMARRRLDVMLLFSNKSLFYLYGYDMAPGVAMTYKTIIAPLDGPPTAHIRNTLVPWTTRIPALQQVRTYEICFDDSNPRETVAILADLKLLSGKTIGIEIENQQLGVRQYSILREEIERGGGTLINASDLVMDLCLRKSKAEVAMMRQAGKLYDVAVEGVLGAIRPGIRECDVNAEAMHAYYAAGGDDVAQPLMLVPAPMTNMLPPTRRRLKAGETLLFEVGGCFNRYHVIGAQPVMCGAKPDADTQAAFKVAIEAAAMMRSLIQPGAATADIARKAIAARGNIGKTETFHGGYSMGIAYRYRWHEDLIIETKDMHVLEEGMTLSIFGFGSAGKAMMFVAIPIVVTKDGFDDLSSVPHDELRVLG
jgi:Xaa-Pro aminopeptidase